MLQLYFLSASAVSQDLCFDLSSVVCEPFLFAVPGHSFQELLFKPEEIIGLNGTRLKKVSPMEWDMMLTPFSLVNHFHEFNQSELDLLGNCTAFVRRERQKLLTASCPSDGARFQPSPRMNQDYAKLLVIGICR